MLLALLFMLLFVASDQYVVEVVQRDDQPLLSYLIQNNSYYKQVFNPTWVEPTDGTKMRKGLIVRTQNCNFSQNESCIFCGGSVQKASLMTISEDIKGNFTPITKNSIVFQPQNVEDAWGTEDPRIAFNRHDNFYYMMYTAYNGQNNATHKPSILLNLARSKNPFNQLSWQRLGPVFPNYQNSKSGAILVRDQPPHYLFWGDSDIRVTTSDNISKWDSIGEKIISPRPDHFDSRLVQSGPPPLLLSDGNYLFFYNSAQLGWPQNPATAYHVGWVILDGKNPAKILSRSQKPLMGPQYSWQKGQAPYLCNVPNVVFLEAAEALGGNKFRVFYGAGDAAIGSAIIQVTIESDESKIVNKTHSILIRKEAFYKQ